MNRLLIAALSVAIVLLLAAGILYVMLYPLALEEPGTSSQSQSPTKPPKPPKPPRQSISTGAQPPPTSAEQSTASETPSAIPASTTTSTSAAETASTAKTEMVELPFPHIYEVPGDWNGKCIIFVHGMGRDKSVWLQDMEEFEKHGYCALAFDLPYHGERGRYDPSKLYDVIKRGAEEVLLAERFLRERGAEDVYLIARSLGSIVSGVALERSGIEKAALLLASANLTYILSSIEPRTEAERAALQQLLSSPEKLREIDPLYHLPGYEGMLQLHCGRRDKLLPPETCVAAYEAASSAESRELIWHDLGHAMPLPEYFDQVLAFFEEGAGGAESGLLSMVEIPEGCGDGVCGAGEDWRTCPYDCIGRRLLVAFQLHIEEMPGRPPYYNESIEVFTRYAETLDRLAAVFEKHGARLSIQTEKQFAEADVEFGRFILRELEARGHGIGVQSHLGHHIGELGLVSDEQKLEYNRLVKEAVARALGHEPTNIGGGFELENVGLLGACDGCLGFTSMTAVEKPYYHQTGSPPSRLHPWILPNTQMIDLSTGEWMIHDEHGSIVYIPGWYRAESFEIDCRLDLGCLDEATRSLQEALRDMEPGKINTWYASTHLYQCGWGSEADKVLEAYDRWLSGLEPLAKKGEIVFMTFDEIAQIYLRWEKARQEAATSPH